MDTSEWNQKNCSKPLTEEGNLLYCSFRYKRSVCGSGGMVDVQA